MKSKVNDNANKHMDMKSNKARGSKLTNGRCDQPKEKFNGKGEGGFMANPMLGGKCWAGQIFAYITNSRPSNKQYLMSLVHADVSTTA
eukprot:CAMPEP_0196250386 /NCGR_PEP_ID=MMETSP0913-20130531/45100_1 /TAXON_ID=49265 /ORGANISM="Thalassiosira rotula, Strain GSO102" /LENGTH=87 /DNA_ID=CAMNT_0041536311 /DNA_START=1 /DNA_END=264 /DNA_ORIENTATION=-